MAAPSLTVRHVKGFACKTRASVAACPVNNGVIYYAAGSVVICAHEEDPQRQQFLRGHTDRITCLAVSGNGAMLASGSCGRNADVVVWEASSRKELFRFSEHDHHVAAVAFSPDGRLLCSVGGPKDSKIFVWDLKTGGMVTKAIVPAALNDDPNAVAAALWAPTTPDSSEYLIATLGSPDIHLWRLDPFRGVLSASKVTSGSVVRSFTTALFSRDCAWLFVGSTSGDVVCLNVVRRAIQSTHPVCSLGVGALLLEGDDLLVAGGDGSLTLLRPLQMRTSEKPRAMLPGGITSLSRTADRRGLIAATDAGRICRVEANSMAVSILSVCHEEAVLGASYRARHLATCSADASVRIWDVETMELCAQIDNPSRRGGVLPLCVFVSEAGEVLSGWGDGQLWCHDLRGKYRWHLHSAHIAANGTGVTAVNISHEGRFLVTGGRNGDVRIWDKGSREMVSHMTQHKDAVCDVKVYNDDRHVISGSKDGTFIIWDVFGERRISSHVSPTGAFTGLELAADQVQVVTVGVDRKLQFWDVRQQTAVQVIDKSHDDICTAVATSAGCEMVATGGADWVVRVWDFKTGSFLCEGHVHSGTVNRVAFSDEDWRRVVSVGEDGFVTFWEVAMPSAGAQ